jgi:hypothetical protein
VPGLTDPGAHAAAIGVCLALIIAGIGLAPLTAAVVAVARRRRARKAEARHDAAVDQAIGNVAGAGGPTEAEVEQMIRDYYQAGEL